MELHEYDCTCTHMIVAMNHNMQHTHAPIVCKYFNRHITQTAFMLYSFDASIYYMLEALRYIQYMYMHIRFGSSASDYPLSCTCPILAVVIYVRDQLKTWPILKPSDGFIAGRTASKRARRLRNMPDGFPTDGIISDGFEAGRPVS